jgi:carboxymethylenebutenolidase
MGRTPVNLVTDTAGPHGPALPRRGMMMTSLIAGFTLAVRPVAAQVIHTSAEGLVTGVTKIPTSDGELPAYFARPDHGTRFPIILVNEEIFGVHEYIRDVCRRLAHLGYLAVATEYYARIADLSKMTDTGRIMTDVILKAPDARYIADAESTLAWAGAHGGDLSRAAVIGFCRGGRQTWLIAESDPRLKAAVSWYGYVAGATSPIQPKTVTDLIGQLKCPVLGLYGGLDPGNPPAALHMLEAKAKADGKTIQIVVYPDAPHGFHADYRSSYRKADAEDGWKRMLAWLDKYGVKS